MGYLYNHYAEVPMCVRTLFTIGQLIEMSCCPDPRDGSDIPIKLKQTEAGRRLRSLMVIKFGKRRVKVLRRR